MPSLRVAQAILERADKHLDAQLKVALAADARGMSLASMLLAFTTAVTAAALAAWAQSKDGGLAIAGLATAVFMFSGAACAAWAARPTDFYLPGNSPRNWLEVSDEPLVNLLVGEAENYDRNIRDNDALLAANVRWMKRAMLLAGVAPWIGLASWFGQFIPWGLVGDAGVRALQLLVWVSFLFLPF